MIIDDDLSNNVSLNIIDVGWLKAISDKGNFWKEKNAYC